MVILMKNKHLCVFVLFFFRYLQADLETYDLRDLKSVFDVIMIDPPLEEYQRRCPGRTFSWRPWEWDEVSFFDIYPNFSRLYFIFLFLVMTLSIFHFSCPYLKLLAIYINFSIRFFFNSSFLGVLGVSSFRRFSLNVSAEGRFYPLI